MKRINPQLSAALVRTAMTCALPAAASPVMASGEAARAPARAEDAGQALLTAE